MAELKVTLKRRNIGRPHTQRDPVKALGLTKIHRSVVKPAKEPIKGMINTLSHLVDDEEI